MSKRFKAVGLPSPVPAIDQRVEGWQCVYGVIDRDEWFISELCPVLIDAMPVLNADSNNVEDVEKTDSIADDSADCARYGLKSMLQPGEMPESMLSPEETEALRRIQHQESRAT
jgi:hypothetical protein